MASDLTGTRVTRLYSTDFAGSICSALACRAKRYLDLTPAEDDSSLEALTETEVQGSGHIVPPTRRSSRRTLSRGDPQVTKYAQSATLWCL